MGRNLFKILGIIFFILLLVGGGVGYYLYQAVFNNNMLSSETGQHELYIPTGAVYNDVLQNLKDQKIIISPTSFDWVAKQMNYPNKIYPGRYILPNKMSNRDLIIKLRTGNQDPVDITINNIRTKDQLLQLLPQQLEADSTKFAKLMNDRRFLASKGFTKDNVITLFISDTYRFNWNTDAETLFDRFYKEYEKYWTGERKHQAKEQRLKPEEVVTLASIVDEETVKKDEMPKVAGVYLNRLRKGQKLEADPTVKFAVGDFSLRRILKKHLQVDSPYNTYKVTGLPPGPIRIPSKAALESVLYPAKHDYIFFCAKDDFSGYHNFAKTLKEHNLNAKRYHQALNKRGIK